MFKKILVAIIGVAIVGTIGSSIVSQAHNSAGDLASCYPKTAVVVALAADDDLVIAKDANGQRWCFSGMEDWAVGDVAAMIMDDMGTETIYDDQIIKARYTGYQAADIQ